MGYVTLFRARFFKAPLDLVLNSPLGRNSGGKIVRGRDYARAHLSKTFLSYVISILGNFGHVTFCSHVISALIHSDQVISALII